MEIIRVYQEKFPKIRLIGKRYGDADRDQFQSFGSRWGEWFQNGWFRPLDPLANAFGTPDDAYIGCMRYHQGTFEYWIGVFSRPDTNVPEGYQSVLLPAGEVGICWIHGRQDNGEIYGMEADKACTQKLLEQNWKPGHLEGGWCFERYACPRFTVPDKEGKVILDYGIYLK